MYNFFKVLHVCITVPIWFYLLHQILVMVDATELMFFLYWVYVPVLFISSIAVVLSRKD